MKTILFLLILTCIILFCIVKKGRERTLSFAVRVLSPICIVVFYLLKISIINEIMSLFKLTNSLISNSDSIRVAIDSAIITLIINIILEFINNPVNISVDHRRLDDMDQVVTSIKNQAHVYCSVIVDFKYKWLKNFYNKGNGIILCINNSKNTSIEIDRLIEYDYINCENRSEVIEINLNKISNKLKTKDKVYFRLDLLSNKNVQWSDEINFDIRIDSKWREKTKKAFINIKSEPIKLIHGEGK